MWKPLLTAPRIPCHFAAPSKGSAPLPCMSLRAHIDWVALEGHAPNRRSRSRKSFGNGGRTPTFRFRPIIYLYTYIYIYIHRNSVFIMDEWKTEKNAWKRISTRTCICFLGKQNTYHWSNACWHCVQLLQSFRLILLMHFNQLRDWILRHDVAWLTRTLLRTETDITTWHRCCVVGRCRRCRFFGLLRRAAKHAMPNCWTMAQTALVRRPKCYVLDQSWKTS